MELVEADPVGIVEIAKALEVKRQTVDLWRWRQLSPPFPEPRWTVGGRPCWHWPDIVAWAKETNRLKD